MFTISQKVRKIMIVIRVIVNTTPEKSAEFLAEVEQDTAEAHGFAGCIAYQWTVSVQEPTRFLLYEEWETLDALNAFKNSEYFQNNGKALFPLISGKPDSVTYEAAALQPA